MVAALALVVLIVQAASLVSRASREASDFGVFFRSGEVLAEGAGPEYYAAADEPSGWYRTIPPAGIWPFVWLSRLGPLGAGLVWALFNLGLVGASVWFTRRLLAVGPSTREVELWALAILFALSSASLQVGQFSSLFTCCWLAAAWGLAHSRDGLAGMSLAAPATIKLYPLFLAPMLLVRSRPVRAVVFLGVGLMVFGLALPFVTFGSRTIPLALGFVNEMLLGEGGRVAGYLALGPGSVTNQGLDAVLLRYLSHSPDFHDLYPLPHVHAPGVSSALGWMLRVGVVAMTLWATWRVKARLSDAHAPLAALALWTSALYVVLPETKARYAVYVFPAFLWLLTAGQPRGALRIAALVFCLLCVLGALPRMALVAGLAFSGSLLLWAMVWKEAAQ